MRSITRSTFVGSWPISASRKMEDGAFQVGLVLLDLAKSADAFVGDDANDGVLADDGAFEDGDLHVGLGLI